MECSCDIDCEVDDFCEPIEEDVRRANKVHKCNECGRDINNGEEYEYFKNKFDGKISVHRTCLDCRSVRDEFFKDWLYGSIWEYFENFVNDCGGEIPEKCLSLNSTDLTPKAQEMILDKIEDYWGIFK